MVNMPFTIAIASGSSSNSFACAKLALFLIVEKASTAVANACKTRLTSDDRGPLSEKAGGCSRRLLNAFDQPFQGEKSVRILEKLNPEIGLPFSAT